MAAPEYPDPRYPDDEERVEPHPGESFAYGEPGEDNAEQARADGDAEPNREARAHAEAAPLPAATSPADADDDAADEPALRAMSSQFARMRSDLQAAVQGSVQAAQEAMMAETTRAMKRVHELEAERAQYMNHLKELEAQVNARVEEMTTMQGRFQQELADRDARIEELAAYHEAWAHKLEKLAELRRKVDEILS